jgi:formate hydrogenlyase subunit 3/multisubunit Na+/H+ antiporter MnhD subunit
MSGESGGLYGLILIVEQVFFMLIGSMLGVRFLIQAGLWTGLAAILYQLRGLGWAFMTLLALIVIGVAVYRLQKHPPN